MALKEEWGPDPKMALKEELGPNPSKWLWRRKGDLKRGGRWGADPETRKKSAGTVLIWELETTTGGRGGGGGGIGIGRGRCALSCAPKQGPQKEEGGGEGWWGGAQPSLPRGLFPPELQGFHPKSHPKEGLWLWDSLLALPWPTLLCW